MIAGISHVYNQLLELCNETRQLYISVVYDYFESLTQCLSFNLNWEQTQKVSLFWVTTTLY